MKRPPPALSLEREPQKLKNLKTQKLKTYQLRNSETYQLRNKKKLFFFKKRVIFTPKIQKSQQHFTNFNAIFVDFSLEMPIL